MANPEHVKWLNEGVEAWNKRRLEDDFVPDLEGANLRGQDLNGANLWSANLGGANLTGGNLTGANLGETDLIGANLKEADLSGAELKRAGLSGAKLRGVKVQTFVYPASTTKDAFDAVYTDVSEVLGLTQTQLNSMQGDSGTKIPDDLTRPAHWPVLDIHKGEGVELAGGVEKAEPPKRPAFPKLTPPAEFESRGEFPNVVYYPVRPTLKNEPSSDALAAYNELLPIVSAVATSLITLLVKYEREAEQGSNRVQIAEQILSAVRDLKTVLDADQVQPKLTEIYVRVLSQTQKGDDVAAMQDVELAMLEELVTQGEKLCAVDPALAEINDVEKLHDLPDVKEEDVEAAARALEEVITSPESKEFFSDSTKVLITKGVQTHSNDKPTNRKRNYLDIRALAGELYREMEPHMEKAKPFLRKAVNFADIAVANVKKIKRWVSTIQFIKKALDFIIGLLG